MARKVSKKPGSPGSKILPPGMQRAIAIQEASADSAQLLADMIEIWGGTRALAADLHAEFQAAPKGGATRQRILEMIQRLVVTNTQAEIGKPRNASDFDDSELEQVALEYAKKVTGHGTAATAEAEPEERSGT